MVAFPCKTERQPRFIELKIQFPYPSSARAARLAGYSEWVAQKADRLISRSPRVRPILEAWNRQEELMVRLAVRRGCGQA